MKNYEIAGTKISNYEFPCDDLEEVPIEKNQGHMSATRNITFDDWRKAAAITMEICESAKKRNDEFGRMEYEEWQELSAALGLKYENRSGAWLMNKNRENAGRGM